LAHQASAHIVVMVIDGDLSINPDRASKGSLLQMQEPPIGIDGLGNSRQRREDRINHSRRVVPTRARLVGPLTVVVGEIRLGEFRDLRAGGWPMDLQALLTKRTMKPFDISIQIGPMRRDDIGLHPQTEQKAHQGGREISSRRAEDLARVVIKSEHAGQAMLAQKLSHQLSERFGIEIATHLVVQPDRSTSIDEVGDLDHMPPLAFWISGYTAGVFEVELDLLPWPPQC
jgi:hypothetical protein